jgi:hypothetical protein
MVSAMEQLSSTVRDLARHSVIIRALVLALAVIAGCDGGDDGNGDGGAMITDCTSSAACGADGETCTAGGQRCECAQHGGGLACESTSCPSTPVGPGTPCSMPGLTCDPDFEFAGYRCTAPENVFTECLPGGTIDSRCPSSRPVEGAPCCWLSFSGVLDPCMYIGDSAMWSCTSDHWVRTP